MLRAFVAQERSVSGANQKESIRLAGEFHMLLARLTGNSLLARYVTELASCCSRSSRRPTATSATCSPPTQRV